MSEESATPKGVLDPSKPKRRGPNKASGADWESIENHYRTGVLSLRQIGELEGVSESAVRKRAKDRGWARDLTERVQFKVREKLIAEEVMDTRRSDPLIQAEIVETASDAVVRVVREHRSTIRESRELLETMLKQLREAVIDREVLELEIDQETEGDQSPKRRNTLYKAVALPTHVVALRDLSLTLRNLVALEREAFGVSHMTAEPVPNAELGGPAEQARAGFGDLRAAFEKRLALMQPQPATP